MKNYNGIQKILHDFVFKNKIINKSLYEIEKVFFLKDLNIKYQSHIFITSLPRSGTTSVLNFLYSSGQYASLTYRNMPFLLSPNFSKILVGKSNLKKERMHGDGIMFNLDSPESFDEVFFKNYEKLPKDELINYLKLILLSQNKNKYLSKNNFNYKRIDLIENLLPNSKFLIPIREPIQQANSLLNQHIHFKDIQTKDDFILRYMNYLYHNEFGLNHLPWNKPINFIEQNDINYWLEQWLLFYKDIINNNQNKKNVIFLVYEELVYYEYLKKILNQIELTNIEKQSINFFKNSNKKILNKDVNNQLYRESENLYKFIKNQQI